MAPAISKPSSLCTMHSTDRLFHFWQTKNIDVFICLNTILCSQHNTASNPYFSARAFFSIILRLSLISCADVQANLGFSITASYLICHSSCSSSPRSFRVLSPSNVVFLVNDISRFGRGYVLPFTSVHLVMILNAYCTYIVI